MSTIKADNISPVGSTLTLTAPVAGLSVASGLTVGGIAFFSGGVTFNSTTNFTGLVTLTGGATSAAVISCGTAPTQGQHLANKTYVDSFRLNVTYVDVSLTNNQVYNFGSNVLAISGNYQAGAGGSQNAWAQYTLYTDDAGTAGATTTRNIAGILDNGNDGGGAITSMHAFTIFIPTGYRSVKFTFNSNIANFLVHSKVTVG